MLAPIKAQISQYDLDRVDTQTFSFRVSLSYFIYTDVRINTAHEPKSTLNYLFLGFLR